MRERDDGTFPNQKLVYNPRLRSPCLVRSLYAPDQLGIKVDDVDALGQTETNQKKMKQKKMKMKQKSKTK